MVWSALPDIEAIDAASCAAVLVPGICQTVTYIAFDPSDDSKYDVPFVVSCFWTQSSGNEMVQASVVTCIANGPPYTSLAGGGTFGPRTAIVELQRHTHVCEWSLALEREFAPCRAVEHRLTLRAI